jgi:hypothetical protein
VTGAVMNFEENAANLSRKKSQIQNLPELEIVIDKYGNAKIYSAAKLLVEENIKQCNC